MNSHKTKYAKSQSKFQVFGKFKLNNINNFLMISPSYAHFKPHKWLNFIAMLNFVNVKNF